MNFRSPILIWGAGAIGGIAGACLLRAGHDVTLVDIDRDHIAAIGRAGLRISGPIDDFTVKVPTFLPADLSGVWHHVLLAVKAQHTEAACRLLAPHLAEDGYVLSLQNGLSAELIAGIIGRPRTLGAFVNYAGDWLEPGHIRFGLRGAVMLGELDGTMTPRLAMLETVMRHLDTASAATTDLGSYIWGKLCFTILLIAQAAGEADIADCLARPELMPLWRGLVGEVVAVARAEGVAPRAFDGVEPDAFTAGAPPAAAERSIAEIAAHSRQGAKPHSGYWRDIAIRKRKTETEALLGPIITLARKHGIGCPLTRRLLAMIGEIENGRRAQADGNLLELLSAIR